MHIWTNKKADKLVLVRGLANLFDAGRLLPYLPATGKWIVQIVPFVQRKIIIALWLISLLCFLLQDLSGRNESREFP